MSIIPDSTTPLYPLRVAAELSGTSVYSLRQYVDLGLIIPYRTESKRRLYSQVDIDRINCIRKYLDDYGLNIAGIKTLFAQTPCWLIRPCTPEDRENCEAYTCLTEPCWNVKEKGSACRAADCRTCEVYKLAEKCSDIKTMFKNLNILNLPENFSESSGQTENE